MARLRAITAASLVVVALAGCGDDDDSAASTSTTSASAPSTTTTKPSVVLDASAPLVTTFESKVFRPSFAMDVPEDWTTVERDDSAFQTYLGANEEFELTLDHTYKTPESVDEGVARLRRTPGLAVVSSVERSVGGGAAKGFIAESDGVLRFEDSGFHTPYRPRIEVLVLPVAGGTTVTVFMTQAVDRSHPEPLIGLAHRMLDSLRWR
jgi:hypothetical protein